MNLREKLETLNNEVSQKYTELRSKYGTVVVLETEDDIEECEDYLEARTDGGDIYGVILIKMDDSGLYIAEVEDRENRSYISLFELADISDRVYCLEIIEENI